jgi:osmotically-inducible protein OsmY
VAAGTVRVGANPGIHAAFTSRDLAGNRVARQCALPAGERCPGAPEGAMDVKTDAAIQLEVLRELNQDQRVLVTDIGVTVHEGVVTLTGEVTSNAERAAAKEAAHRVAGVLDVANDLHVKVPSLLGHTDTEIALAVRKALEWDALVMEEHIHSTVADGWVTLEGTVRLPEEREDAERSVRYMAGVRGVTNLIAVGPSGTPPGQGARTA